MGRDPGQVPASQGQSLGTQFCSSPLGAKLWTPLLKNRDLGDFFNCKNPTQGIIIIIIFQKLPISATYAPTFSPANQGHGKARRLNSPPASGSGSAHHSLFH